jgi:hypothetical protein
MSFHKPHAWYKNHSRAVPKIELRPIPHVSTKIVERMDEELVLLQKLSQKRRMADPRPEKVVISKEPVPDILSRDYEKYRLSRNVVTFPMLIPRPSLFLSGPLEEQPIIIKDAKLKKVPVPKIASKDIAEMILQAPMKIYMQQRVPKRIQLKKRL